MVRFNLPDVTFANKSAEQIEADIVSRFEQETGITLTKADPRRKFIQAIVYALSLQRSNIDYSAKQNLLAYAEGDFLDHIGAQTPRLEAKYATTTMRFTLSIATQQTIRAGTRVTAGDGIFFATKQDVTVTPGQSSVDVEVECTTAGKIGNGYVVGQINQLVDPIQWVQSVENITESSGGADAEDDDAYAERIRQAPEGYSTAGPEGAYVFWAKSANQSIIDVSVSSPSPCNIEIILLMEGGEVPSQEVIDQVLTVCTDKKIRPLGDRVTVQGAEQVPYDINLTYWIGTSNSTIASSIQEKVNQAIEEYKVWQKSKLGRDIDPSELYARVKAAGAKRVVVTSPVFVDLQGGQVAKENIVTVTYGGLEND